MTVPMGNNSAKRYSYYYDREGRQVGMDVEAVSVTSNPTLTAGSSGSNTRFFYNNSRNRVKLITKSGDAYYFVYDPTASIPAVVYEAAGNTAYMNVREPSGALIGREKYVSGVYQYGRTYHFDGLGSTIALTDENGVTTDTYTYRRAYALKSSNHRRQEVVIPATEVYLASYASVIYSLLYF